MNDSTARSKQGHAYARAALAGNPSDMYGGAVFAIPVRSLQATVTIEDGPASCDLALVAAALARVGVSGRARWTTTIPRSVGLAGSSALVIAALRASGRAPRDQLELAQLALSVERDDLGTAGGLQDRAAEAFEAPVLVDVSGDAPIVTPIVPAKLLRFVVAWSAAAAQDSGEYHRAVRVMPSGMAPLADVARAAATAFAAGDADELEALMGRSAELRRGVAPFPPPHEALADHLRAAGFVPNSAGSGGAVVAVLRDEARLRDLSVDYVVEECWAS